MTSKWPKKRQATEGFETRGAEGAKSWFLREKVILERKSDFGAKKWFWREKVILERKSDFGAKSAKKWKWVKLSPKKLKKRQATEGFETRDDFYEIFLKILKIS